MKKGLCGHISHATRASFARCVGSAEMMPTRAQWWSPQGHPPDSLCVFWKPLCMLCDRRVATRRTLYLHFQRRQTME